MNFGTFQLQHFSHEELAAILGNRVNQVFYPSATIDVKRLQGYWFLSTTCMQSFPQLDDDDSFIKRLGSYLTRRNQIDSEYEGFAKFFGSPEQILALFPWHKYLGKEIMEDEWGRFMWPQDFLPLTIEVNYDFLSSPQSVPDLSILQMEEIPMSTTRIPPRARMEGIVFGAPQDDAHGRFELIEIGLTTLGNKRSKIC